MSDTANSTEKPHQMLTRLIREHFRQMDPNTLVDRIKKLLAEPDDPEIMGKCFIEECTCGGVVGKDPIDRTVREEWAMACPKCGDDKEIDVLASAYVRLTPDDTDADASHDSEHAWSSQSATKCCACGHMGIAREFTITEEEINE